MKRSWFRFRVRALLMLPVLFAIGWWWITWPDRTAKRFVQLLATGNVQGAKNMIEGPQASDAFWRIVDADLLDFDVSALQTRSGTDYVWASRGFDVNCKWDSGSSNLGSFIAVRDTVQVLPYQSPTITTAYVLDTTRNDAAVFVGRIRPLYRDSRDVHLGVDETRNHVIARAPKRVHQEILALVALCDQDDKE